MMPLKLLTVLLLITSIIFFTLGLIYPIISIKQSLLGIGLEYKEVKLFDSVKMFYSNGDYLLSIIIFLFTFFLPIIEFIELINKILTLYKIPKKISAVLKTLDKWSMLDVFLVALLLLNFKMDSNFVVMKLQIGTNFIALAVILRLISSSLTNRYIIETNETNETNEA